MKEEGTCPHCRRDHRCFGGFVGRRFCNPMRRNSRILRHCHDEKTACHFATLGLQSSSGRKSSRFQLQELMGIGGVCEVYAALDLRRAEWSDANPRVAIKRLLPELQYNYQAQLFLAQEFSILRHLSHHGIVRVFDLHHEPFGLCYSMELLEGAPLTPMLGSMGKTSYAIVSELFMVLAYLHSRGVTHGDIKPTNIFLESGKRVVLIDFNTAVLSENGEYYQPAQCRGLRQSLRLPAHSALYSSPECLAGHIPTAASDVFSACCTVYEFLSGRHPFSGVTPDEALRSGATVLPPDGMPKGLWHCLQSGLDADPAQRPHAESLSRHFAVPSGYRRLWQVLRQHMPL